MKRLALMLTVFLLISIPLAGISALIPPKYRARGEIRIRPVIPRLVFQTEENGAIPYYHAFVNTQAALLTGPQILQRVLDRPEVRATQWYKEPAMTLLERWRGDVVPPVERLKDDLSVQARPETEIIDVSFTALNTDDAKLIVNTVLDRYMQYVGECSNATEERLYRQLAEQYHSLQIQIVGGERTYAELCAEVGTDTPQALVSARRLRVDETEARLNELRHRIKVLTSDVNQIGAADGNSAPSGPAAGPRPQPKYYEDVEWRKLNIDVRNIEFQIADSEYLPTNPAGMKLRRQLEFAKTLRRERETQLDELWRDNLKNGASASPLAIDATGASLQKEHLAPQRELARARYEEKLLREEYQTQQTQFRGLFERAQLLEKESRDLQHKRELFDAIRRRKEQKDIERNVPGPIEVLASAQVDNQPCNDHRIVCTAIALALGLVGAGGAAILTRKKK